MPIGFGHVKHRRLPLAAAGGADDASINEGVYASCAAERRRPVLTVGGKEGRVRLKYGITRVRGPPVAYSGLSSPAEQGKGCEAGL